MEIRHRRSFAKPWKIEEQGESFQIRDTADWDFMILNAALRSFARSKCVGIIPCSALLIASCSTISSATNDRRYSSSERSSCLSDCSYGCSLSIAEWAAIVIHHLNCSGWGSFPRGAAPNANAPHRGRQPPAEQRLLPGRCGSDQGARNPTLGGEIGSCRKQLSNEKIANEFCQQARFRGHAP